MWELYKRRPGIVLGFHGCDEQVGESVLAGKRSLGTSTNDYDWLGNGVYFWEGNPARALHFAKQATQKDQRVTRGKVRKPFVIGAIIDLGYCCNLVDSDALSELKVAYDYLAEMASNAGEAVPANRGADNDLKARFRDCLVIETMHRLRETEELQPYDTVRCPFWEGGELYPGAGFTTQAHIQIAVRTPKSILGYFRPIKRN